MWAVVFLLFLSGAWPLLRAWQQVRTTSLAHALVWATGTWGMWVVLSGLTMTGATGVLPAGRYVGLCLVACAGVAVLGARRPGVAAWNFVVLGLLAVLLLSWLEGFVTGAAVEWGGVRAVFLAGTLGLVALNYLPTRLGVAAVCLAAGCALELVGLGAAGRVSDLGCARDWPVAEFFLALVPWAAWAGLHWHSRPPLAVDDVWLAFRDAYGLVWAQRVREQFNRAVAHDGLPVVLGWQGLRSTDDGATPDAAAQSASDAILQALFKRFGLVAGETTTAPVAQ